MNDIFETRVVEHEKVQFNRPVVIGGFVGGTGTGFIAASYIIEQLNMHQIAHVRSSHIPPVSVFIGKKLRAPFRIYTNRGGTLIVIISEVPVDREGLYEIAGALLSWVSEKSPQDFIILEGVPVQQIVRDHTVQCVANESKLKEFTDLGVEPAQSTLISGMGGAILYECMLYDVPGSTFMTQSPANIADPGSVLALIETVNSAFKLNIDTAILEDSVRAFHEQLQDLINQYRKTYSSDEKPSVDSMYG